MFVKKYNEGNPLKSIDIEYDSAYWHNKNSDDKRDQCMILKDWKILRIKSGSKIPDISKLINSINILINSSNLYTEIMLDDWYEKEAV